MQVDVHSLQTVLRHSRKWWMKTRIANHLDFSENIFFVRVFIRGTNKIYLLYRMFRKKKKIRALSIWFGTYKVCTWSSSCNFFQKMTKKLQVVVWSSRCKFFWNALDPTLRKFALDPTLRKFWLKNNHDWVYMEIWQSASTGARPSRVL